MDKSQPDAHSCQGRIRDLLHKRGDSRVHWNDRVCDSGQLITAKTCPYLTGFDTRFVSSEATNLGPDSSSSSDPGVSFIAFSELLSSIPFTAFWSVVFFFTFFCLGCDYQISMIRSFLVAIEDAYGSHVKRNFLAHQIFTLLICVFSFVLSLVFLTQVTILHHVHCLTLAFISQQGLLLIQAFDQYVTVLLTLVLAFCEMMLMGWFYGRIQVTAGRN